MRDGEPVSSVCDGESLCVLMRDGKPVSSVCDGESLCV